MTEYSNSKCFCARSHLHYNYVYNYNWINWFWAQYFFCHVKRWIVQECESDGSDQYRFHHFLVFAKVNRHLRYMHLVVFSYSISQSLGKDRPVQSYQLKRIHSQVVQLYLVQCIKKIAALDSIRFSAFSIFFNIINDRKSRPFLIGGTPV